MAGATDTKTHKKMADEMNQTDLTSESETAQQQTVERQPLLSSQPSDPSHNHFQQQHVHASPFTSAKAEDEVIMEIKEMIQDCGDGLLSPHCCIYRVPNALRHLKEEAYTPQVVSIGPFHHGNDRLQNMERHKQIFFNRFTQRAASRWQDLVPIVQHLVPKVRASYSETIELSQKQLVKLILMDASFIIVLFMSKTFELCNDAKLSQQLLESSIKEDLLLSENQLPFFVIEELFNKAFPQNHDGGSGPSFLELAYVYFGKFNKQKLDPNPDVKIKHFTDLVRLFYLPEKMPQREDLSEGHVLLYNANALQEAGIKLKAGTSKCLLDLKFSGHVLEIPKIYVEDSTEFVFRNMIALEQCLYPDATYIIDYTTVLDCLVDTHKDVDLLVRKKIVDNFILGDSNNVAALFNGLGKNVIQSSFNCEFLDICKRLNSYCEDPWHNMKATLKRDYCRTPWQIVASIAAVVLLFLTVVQTIFSFFQVVK